MLALRCSLLFFAIFGAAIGCGGATTGGPADAGSPATSTGAGGSSGTGGSGTGGNGGTAGICTAGATAFHMSAASGNDADYCVGLQCSAVWMTISSLDGVEMPIAVPCETPCTTCQPIGCPALCIAPQPMKAGGERITWDGTFWEASTCGSNTACRQHACAAPGRYKVKMCAAPRTSDAGPFCMPGATPTCAELEFDYPSPATVEGVLQ
jgi:hypothetical protein